jgi:hypothetical protein
MHKDSDPKNVRTRDADKPAGRDANRDPITGEPGAHPVGAGAGAAAGAAAGGVVGSFGGPVGTVVGAAIGGVAGGLAGKAAGEAVNPTEEDGYWRANYTKRSYIDRTRTYDDYAPAYRYGWESCCTYAPSGRTFDQAEPDLQKSWTNKRATSTLDWTQARPAARDAWDRVQSRVCKT